MCPSSAQRLFTFEQIYKVLVGLKTFLRLRHLQGHQGKSKIRKVKRQSVFLSHQHQKLRLTSFHDFIRRWSLHLLERRFLLSEPLMHVGKLTSMRVFPPLIRWCGWEVWARPKMSRLLYADQDTHRRWKLLSWSVSRISDRKEKNIRSHEEDFHSKWIFI